MLQSKTRIKDCCVRNTGSSTFTPFLTVFFCHLRAYAISALEVLMTSHQLLRLKQVEVKTGLKRSQIYLYMKEGAFPYSIKI